MNNKKLIPVLALLLMIAPQHAAVCAQAQTQFAEGTQQFAELRDFKLQSGSVIHDFKVGYRTLGKLNAEKSNAILWPTWLGGTSEQLSGPGRWWTRGSIL